MSAASIYKALGDPIRLEIVRRLASCNSSTLGELSQDLGVSRQGARKQIQVLVSAQLVHLTQCGRITEARLDHATLQQAQQHLDQLGKLWDQRLLALKDFAESHDNDT